MLGCFPFGHLHKDPCRSYSEQNTAIACKIFAWQSPGPNGSLCSKNELC